MIYIPILGALLEATGMILEKKVMKKKSMNYKNYTVYGFFAIVVAMIPFLFFFWRVSPEALQLNNLLVMLGVILSAFFANLFIFYSLKRESLCELEPIRLMQPLFTILFAFILSFFFAAYSDEKNTSILILALIASITLIVTHFKKDHLNFDKYILAALAGSILFAVELVLSKIILPYYSSWSFYFLRCLFILMIAAAVFRPSFKKVDKQTHYFAWIIGFIWIFYRIILYWGYESFGIIFTTILLILTPVFIFIFARIFLKEKINFKQMVSAIIILLCVATAVLLKNYEVVLNFFLSLF
jgi:drug/metabolite transporter (DMT)-like permease